VNTNNSPIIVEQTNDEALEPEIKHSSGEVGGNPPQIVVEQQPPTKTIVT